MIDYNISEGSVIRWRTGYSVILLNWVPLRTYSTRLCLAHILNIEALLSAIGTGWNGLQAEHRTTPGPFSASRTFVSLRVTVWLTEKWNASSAFGMCSWRLLEGISREVKTDHWQIFDNSILFFSFSFFLKVSLFYSWVYLRGKISRWMNFCWFNISGGCFECVPRYSGAQYIASIHLIKRSPFFHIFFKLSLLWKMIPWVVGCSFDVMYFMKCHQKPMQ